MLKEPTTIERILELFFKVLLPAAAGVSVKIAIKMQKEKMTVLGVVLSYVAGILLAWIVSPVITNAVSKDYVPMMIAVVAISGDKIAEYLIYKFNIDLFITVLLDHGRTFLIGLLTKK